jgi:hypothetical protein
LVFREEEEKKKKKNHYSIYLRTCERNHRKTLNRNSEEKFTKKKKATKQLFGKYPQERKPLVCQKRRADEGGKRKKPKSETKTKTYSTSKKKQ